MRVKICAFVFLVAGISSIAGALDKGNKAADFSLKDLSGKTVKLSDYKGKVVLLNFWASWCPPCREEMPSIQKLYARMKGKKFSILAVSVDRGGENSVRRFIKEAGYEFKILLDPEGEAASRYSVGGIPATFIIDKKGEIVDKIIGAYQWDDEGVIKKINDLSQKRGGE